MSHPVLPTHRLHFFGGVAFRSLAHFFPHTSHLQFSQYLGTCSCRRAALATGLAVTNTAAFGAITALVCASGLAGVRAIGAIDEPLKLFRSDAAALLPFGGGAIEGAPESGGANGGGGDTISSFYRSSTLLGLVLGASFLVSPVSPIGLFESEAPVTHFFRQVPFSHSQTHSIYVTPHFVLYITDIFSRGVFSLINPILPICHMPLFLYVTGMYVLLEQGLGAYICCVLCPVQAALFGFSLT